MKEISANTVSPALSVKEIGQFHRDGFVGPFTLAPPEAMAVARERIEKEVLDIAPKFTSVGAKTEQSSPLPPPRLQRCLQPLFPSGHS